MLNRILGYAAIALAACPIFFASCTGENEKDTVASPELISCIPSDGAEGLEGPKLDVVLSYDQNVKCLSSKHSQITVSGGASVTKVNAYMENVTISLDGLEGGKSYVLTVPEGVVEGFKSVQKPSKAVSLSFSVAESSPAPGPQTHYSLDPVTSLSDANATSQAQKVYQFLLQESGKRMLTGVQSEGTANNNDHVNSVYSLTGRHPALAGYDFIFLQFSPTPDDWSWKVNYGDMSAPIGHWNEGGLVNYMWHWNVPNSKDAWEKGKTGNFDGYGFYTSEISFSIAEALKEGTWQHDFIMQDIAKVAGYLKILSDAGVPVIWRPLHEAAGNYNLYGIRNNAWFWWGKGGAEACKSLYRLLRDQLENVYGLHNLIWVWTLDATKGAEAEWANWYPGDEYVDIIGVDIYEDNTEAKNFQYQAAVDLAKGKKLVTVSECGNIPDPAKCFNAGNKWNWFLVWSSGTSNYRFNTQNYWKQVMSSEYTISREDMPSLK